MHRHPFWRPPPFEATQLCSTGAEIINGPRVSPFPSTQRCALPENRRGNKHAVSGPRTDRGRQAPFSGGPKHDSAIKFGVSPYLWGANWRSGHHISKPATAKRARAQKWITPLWPIILLRLGSAVVRRSPWEQSCPPNAANSPPSALHSICVRRSMC